MGMAKLNIWVSGFDDPCSIDDRTWYVTIYNCDGTVLDWCGRRYIVLPAKCGHLQVEVPPGTYYIRAVWSFGVKPIFWGNHFTDPAIVQAVCEETTCVKLFNPSAHRCGYILVRAVRDLAKQKAIEPDLAERVEKAVKAALEVIPRPEREFELGHADEIEKLVREQEGKGGK
jgi:hypothetical protein